MTKRALVEENQTLRSENAELREKEKQLEQQLDWFKRQLFGRKSEKVVIDTPDQLDLDLFGERAESLSEESIEQITYSRRKKDRGDSVTDSGLRFDETVPVEVIELEAPELSGEDADDFEVISRRITHRLAQRPGAYVVLEYRRPVVKRKSDQAVWTTLAPGAVLERCFGDVSFLAGLLVDKLVYHLPLYRQHQRLSACGITLSRSTLTNYVHRSIELLRPIHEAQWQNILESRVLAVDETPIKAGRKRKKKRKQPGEMKTTYYWPVYGEDDEVCFTWSDSRETVHIERCLGDFKGTLLSDGYIAYEKYAKARPDVTQAQCWAHVRRGFERAKDSDPGASRALEMIKAIYEVEKNIRKRALDREQTLQARSRRAKPLVDRFLEWCRSERNRPDLLKSDLLSKALHYTLERVESLQVYLGDPDVAIDTNHLERTLRVVPMGKKNWLFCWTEIGAELVGIAQSLLTTCRLQGVDPFTYLVDVLQRISTHPQSRVDELTPRRWKELFAGDPLRSNLERAGA